MYSSGGSCIAAEGYVKPCRAMYNCEGLCIALEGYV